MATIIIFFFKLWQWQLFLIWQSIFRTWTWIGRQLVSSPFGAQESTEVRALALGWRVDLSGYWGGFNLLEFVGFSFGFIDIYQ